MGTLINASFGVNYLPQIMVIKKYSEIQKSKEKDLISKIEKIVDSVAKSSRPVQEVIQEEFSEIFEIRLRLIKWVIEKKVDFLLVTEELLNEFQEIYKKTNKSDEIVLFENTIFSLKTIMKITNSILSQYSFSIEDLEEIDTISLSYNQLRIAIQLEPLSNKIKLKLIRFINTSLSLDFVLMLVALLILQKYEFLKSRTVELSRLLRDWTQTYGALAIELGLWVPRVEKAISKTGTPLTIEEVREQQGLAELGMEDYLRQISEEEESE